jgi:tetratricopeptide (TPR) repeat protein
MAAALQLDPDGAAAGPARPLLERGRAALDRRPEPFTAHGYYLRARYNELLEDYDPAVRAYDLALSMAPDKHSWRIDYVKLLMDQEKWPQAFRELTTLRRQFSSAEIDNWYRSVERRLKTPP